MTSEVIHSLGTLLRIAVIGSGPSAFYAAEELLKVGGSHVEVHMFEQLPSPYGLVRGGVAPDHQNIKSVTKIYERVAAQPGFYFWGNVTFGRDIHQRECLEWFHAIVYATGAPADRVLNVPGEHLINSFGAGEFVGWYNGHPHHQARNFDFSGPHAAIIGIGNVALDIARILTKPLHELATTDLTQAAIETLKNSQIQTVYLIARRGPLHAACTPAELRELASLEGVSCHVDPHDMILPPEATDEHRSQNTTKNLEWFETFSKNTTVAAKQIRFLFHYTPVEFTESHHKISGIKLKKTDGSPDGSVQDEYLAVDYIFKSIGSKGIALPGVPYSPQTGTFPHQQGEIQNDRNPSSFPQEYVTGWAKRGASGVIGTNKSDSRETITTLLANLSKYPLPKIKPLVIETELKNRSIAPVTFEQWKKIDAAEIESGKVLGKIREKNTSLAHMIRIAHA